MLQQARLTGTHILAGKPSRFLNSSIFCSLGSYVRGYHVWTATSWLTMMLANAIIAKSEFIMTFLLGYGFGFCYASNVRSVYWLQNVDWWWHVRVGEAWSFWSVQLGKVICPLRSGAAIDYIVGYSDVRDEWAIMMTLHEELVALVCHVNISVVVSIVCILIFRNGCTICIGT